MPAASRRQRAGSRRSPPSALIGLAGPVPFQHGEFGMVQRAALAVAEHLGEVEDAPLAGRQQLLAGEFRRGAQIEPRPARRPAPRASVAKACRWVSLPGETCRTPVSTSMKPRREPGAQRRHDRGSRASRNGRRSAWTCGRPRRRRERDGVARRFRAYPCWRAAGCGNMWRSGSGSLWCAAESAPATTLRKP